MGWPASASCIIPKKTAMTYDTKKIIALGVLIGLYCILYYFILNQKIRLDFSSFYSSAEALALGKNPYQMLYTSYFATVKKLSPNLNPPILFVFMSPLAIASYHTSLVVTTFLSLFLNLVSITLTYKLFFSPAFFKRHFITLYVLYFALFSTFANTAIVQLGSVIFFLLMSGYYCYRKNQFAIASMLWGILIAIKIFPALLFFYVLKQRRYKMLVLMGVTVIVMCLIPWLVYGPTIYSDYIKMLSRVRWYGDSWNGSIYGFLFRLFIDINDPAQKILLIQIIFSVLCLGSFAYYLKALYSITTANDEHHQQFCLTIVAMLLFSPLGWMYYFSILTLPLLYTWSQVNKNQTKISPVALWVLCLFCINFPIDYVRVKDMSTLIEKLTLHSFYFYGLLILSYFLIKKDNNQTQLAPDCNADAHWNHLIIPITSTLCFGIVIISISFILRARALSC